MSISTSVEEQLTACVDDVNGPTEVGIGALSDTGKDPSNALPVEATRTERIGFVISWCIGAGITSSKLRSAVVAAGELAVKNQMYDDTCNIVKKQKAPAVALTKEDFDTVVITPEVVVIARTLVAATKVTFWQTNHHVGVQQMSGFYAKVATACFENVAANQLYKAGWAIGHWFSTVKVLAAMGVRGVKKTGTAVPVWTPTKDVSIRLAGLPAGCAKLAFCAAVIERIGHGVLGDYLVLPVGCADVIEAYGAVCAMPIAYHVGALHLTNEQRKVSVDVPSDILNALSAYVYAIMPGSTLAKSRAIADEGAARDHPWFAIIAASRKAILGATMVDESELQDAINKRIEEDKKGTKARILADEVSRIVTKAVSAAPGHTVASE